MTQSVSVRFQGLRAVATAAHFPFAASHFCRINRQINLPNDKIFIFCKKKFASKKLSI
jgi:hypothetical protein